MKNSTSRTLLACLGLSLGLALALPVAAQWKWKDSTGKLQYSDRPPPATVPERDILQRPSNVRSVAPAPAAETPAAPVAAAASAPGVDKDLEARRRAEEQARQAKEKAEKDKIAQARAENCARARSYMQTLDSGVRIARTNEKGEREILGDEARAAEVARTRELIAANCD